LKLSVKPLNCSPKPYGGQVNYLGNLEAQHHLKIKSNEETYNAFIVDKLMKAIRVLWERFEVEHLLLILTSDPVVMLFYQYTIYGFKANVRLVHDYVNTE
jgi:hypothetical protein